MKGGNKFLIWSKQRAHERQARVAYCFWAGLWICLVLVGILFSNFLNTEKIYIASTSFLMVFVCSRFYNKHFFQEKTIIALQQKYLRQWKDQYQTGVVKRPPEKLQEDLADIELALQEMSYRAMTWA